MVAHDCSLCEQCQATETDDLPKGWVNINMPETEEFNPWVATLCAECIGRVVAAHAALEPK